MASENETTEDQTTPNEGTDIEDTPAVDPITGEESVEEITVDLIVEDGSCVADANSFVTLEEAVKYQASHGRKEWLELTKAEQIASLIKGTQYVDNLFTWKGRRKYETQVLAFPRVPRFPKPHLLDFDGFDYTGKIPQKIKDAVCEAAFYGYQAELFTVYAGEGGGAIKKERNKDNRRVEGAVQKEIETEIEYFSNKEMEVDYVSKYAALNVLLRGYYVDTNVKTVNHHAIWMD